MITMLFFSYLGPRSLKWVSWHSGDEYAFILMVHSTVEAEEYQNLEMILNKLQYDNNKGLTFPRKSKNENKHIRTKNKLYKISLLFINAAEFCTC